MVSFQGGEPLLTVRDLAVDLRHRHGVVHAVRGLSYSLDKGEAMGMVGESGSGKTISSLALLGLLPAGITAWFAGAYSSPIVTSWGCKIQSSGHCGAGGSRWCSRTPSRA